MAKDGVERAIAALRMGRAVVFPTDTVYGVGVAAGCAPSPQELYDIKRRDAGKPVAWLVGGLDDLRRYGRDVSECAIDAARRHWPGALTLVVSASDAVPHAFAPAGTIGLRMPDSPCALALIRAVGPIATSSANRSGAPAPRSLPDVDADLLAEVAAVVEGDVPARGIASTVVDATGPRLAVLRQGIVVL